MTTEQQSPKILSDSNGNTAEVLLFGSEEAARKALESLVGCRNCRNCSHCSGCYGCSRCYGCCDCCDCSGCCDCSVCCAAKRAIVVPIIADIHRTLLEAIESTGTLEMSRCHTCDTTHCRAGWVVHLAGEAGYDLERRTSLVFAALQIYKASGYDISPVRFFDSDEDAMADIRRLAGGGE